MLRLRMAAVITGILLASMFSLPSFADGIATLSIDPASGTVSTGASFFVNVNVADVTNLYDFQFDISFNPAVLQATNVLEGTFLSSGGGTTFFLPGTIDNTAGNVTFNADTLLSAVSGVSGNGTLAHFDFTALSSGTSDFTISNVILQDSTGAILDNTTTGGSVTSAIPEPSSLMLLGTGLLVLGGITLKKTIL